MAVNEGISSRKDFNDALAEAGETVIRIAEREFDDDGNRTKEQRIEQRVLIETIQVQQPGLITNVGGANVNASGMQIIYLSPDDGEPFDDEIIERGRFRSKLARVDFLSVDNEIVYYFANLVRVAPIRSRR